MEKQWAQRFAPWVFRRGRRLQKTGAVSRLHCDGETAAALVQDDEVCLVGVSLEGNLVRRVGCSCILADDGTLCSHMVAMMLALEDRGTDLQMPLPEAPMWKERKEFWNPEVVPREQDFKGRRRAEVMNVLDNFLSRTGRRSEKLLADEVERILNSSVDPLLERGQSLDAFLVVCAGIETICLRGNESMELQTRISDLWTRIYRQAGPGERNRMYHWFASTSLRPMAVRTMLFDLDWEPEQLLYTISEIFPAVFRNPDIPDAARILQTVVLISQKLNMPYARLRAIFSRLPDWSIACPPAIISLDPSQAQVGLTLLRLCRDFSPRAPEVIPQCRSFLGKLYKKGVLSREDLVRYFTFRNNTRMHIAQIREILSRKDFSEMVSRMLEDPAWAHLRLDLLLMDARYRDVYDLLMEKGTIQDLNRCSAILEQWSSARLRTLYATMCLKLGRNVASPRDARVLTDAMKKLLTYNNGRTALENVALTLRSQDPHNPILNAVLTRMGV